TPPPYRYGYWDIPAPSAGNPELRTQNSHSAGNHGPSAPGSHPLPEKSPAPAPEAPGHSHPNPSAAAVPRSPVQTDPASPPLRGTASNTQIRSSCGSAALPPAGSRLPASAPAP